MHKSVHYINITCVLYIISSFVYLIIKMLYLLSPEDDTGVHLIVLVELGELTKISVNKEACGLSPYWSRLGLGFLSNLLFRCHISFTVAGIPTITAALGSVILSKIC